jgi:preprotein translocase subunit YajC
MNLVSILSNSASDEPAQGSALPTLIIFALIPLAMYFLMIRPQRRRQREAAAMQSSIGIGDEVMTSSGVYGFVTGFDGDIAWLEIDENVQIRISRQALQRKVDTSAAVDAPDDSRSTPIDDSEDAT